MARGSKKVAQQSKRNNLKSRKSAAKRRKKARQKAKNRRPRRNLLGDRHFYTLEAFLCWIHKFLGGLLDKKLPPKAKQAKYHHQSLFFAFLLRSLLRIAHLSRLVDHLESNRPLSRALGFLHPLKNTKPLTELLLKLSFPIAKWLFLQTLLQARAHGLVFGKTISVDTCFLHIHGKTYENAKRGYSGQLKRKALGYKLWVAFSVESKRPLSFHLDSGNVADTAYFKRCVSQAGYVLGDGVLKRVVADRGFCSRELYLWLGRVMHLKFAFRAKAGKTNTYVQSAVDALERKDFRYLGSNTRYAKVEVTGFEEQRLRLFVGKHKGFKKDFLLITNDFSLEYRGIRRLYLSRWSVESYFHDQKGGFLLGKFCCTRWRAVFAEVTCSLLASMLLSIFRLLLGRRYRRFSPNELIERVLLHGFSCEDEELSRPSYAKGRALVAALQRLNALLEQWGNIEKENRFKDFRPKGFQEDVFDLPNISVAP